MRFSRQFSVCVLLVILGQALVLAHPVRHGQARPALVPAFVRQAMAALRERIRHSALAVAAPADPEQERRDFVALWADLEPRRGD